MLSQQPLADLLKEVKQLVIHSLEIVYLAQILQLLLQLIFVRIELVLWTLLLRVIRNVRAGYQPAFGKELQDAQTHRHAHYLQEQLTHVLPSQRVMDHVMEQELQRPLLALPIIPFAQLLHQPIIQMHNARLGDLFVSQMDLDVFWLQLPRALVYYHLLSVHSINQL